MHPGERNPPPSLPPSTSRLFVAASIMSIPARLALLLGDLFHHPGCRAGLSCATSASRPALAAVRERPPETCRPSSPHDGSPAIQSQHAPDLRHLGVIPRVAHAMAPHHPSILDDKFPAHLIQVPPLQQIPSRSDFLIHRLHRVHHHRGLHVLGAFGS